jgi:hypothetical protein
LADINQAHAEWHKLLSQIDREDMIKPMQLNDWSIKDVIAPITWHEREMVNVIQARALVGSELWEQPMDMRNTAICETDQNQSLEEILSDAKQTHTDLIQMLETLTDDELNNTHRFDQMPANWTPWDLIAGNTSRHYRDHSSDLKAWMV